MCLAGETGRRCTCQQLTMKPVSAGDLSIAGAEIGVCKRDFISVISVCIKKGTFVAEAKS